MKKNEKNKKQQELEIHQQQIESDQKEYENYCKEEQLLQKQLDSIQEENNQIIQLLNNKTIVNLIQTIQQQNKHLNEDDPTKTYPLIQFSMFHSLLN